MLPKLLVPSIIVCLSTSGLAQTSMPDFSVASAEFSFAYGMDFKDRDGTLNSTRFEISSFLSKPLIPFPGLKITPQLRYEFTAFDFDHVTSPLALRDEDLHAVSLSVVAIKSDSSSPWFYAGFAKVDLASDFQVISGDDFTFDLAGGGGYRFNEDFTLGVGVAITNLNGDVGIYPGINFDWKINDQLRVGQYGPLFNFAYTPSENWRFHLRGEPRGGIWNLTNDDGRSESIDLSSYQFGAFVSHRLAGELWLTAGAGATFGNEIRLTTPSGRKITAEEMDTGLFGQIGLRLTKW